MKTKSKFCMNSTIFNNLLKKILSTLSFLFQVKICCSNTFSSASCRHLHKLNKIAQAKQLTPPIRRDIFFKSAACPSAVSSLNIKYISSSKIFVQLL